MTRRLLAATPVLVVADIARAIEFYASLGFIEPATWGDPPSFGMMNRDGLDLMFSCRDASRPLPTNAGHGAWDLALRVADLDAEIAALRAAGIALTRGPETTFYCMREIEVLDPDGHRICLGQDVTPGEAQEKV